MINSAQVEGSILCVGCFLNHLGNSEYSQQGQIRPYHYDSGLRSLLNVIDSRSVVSTGGCRIQIQGLWPVDAQGYVFPYVSLILLTRFLMLFYSICCSFIVRLFCCAAFHSIGTYFPFTGIRGMTTSGRMRTRTWPLPLMAVTRILL